MSSDFARYVNSYSTANNRVCILVVLQPNFENPTFNSKKANMVTSVCKEHNVSVVIRF